MQDIVIAIKNLKDFLFLKNPQSNINIPCSKKLDNSPTPIVFESKQKNKFLVKKTKTPAAGPNINDAKSAGISEKSILMKYKTGKLKPKKAKMIEEAESNEIMAIFSLLFMIHYLFKAKLCIILSK